VEKNNNKFKRTEQVKSALLAFNEKLVQQQESRAFDLQLKGLGSWSTKSNCLCLYADLGRECCLKVKNLAKEMSDFVKDFVMMGQPNVEGKMEEKEEQKELSVEQLIIPPEMEKEYTGIKTEKNIGKK